MPACQCLFVWRCAPNASCKPALCFTPPPSLLPQPHWYWHTSLATLPPPKILPIFKAVFSIIVTVTVTFGTISSKSHQKYSGCNYTPKYHRFRRQCQCHSVSTTRCHAFSSLKMISLFPLHNMLLTIKTLAMPETYSAFGGKTNLKFFCRVSS